MIHGFYVADFYSDRVPIDPAKLRARYQIKQGNSHFLVVNHETRVHVHACYEFIGENEVED